MKYVLISVCTVSVDGLVFIRLRDISRLSGDQIYLIILMIMCGT